MVATTESVQNESRVVEVAPDLLARWLESGEAVVVDVREDYEHAEERIDGAVTRPLAKLDPRAIRGEFPDKRVVYQCRTGRRSLDAANRSLGSGEPVFHLAGGLEAWKSAGQRVVRAASGPRLPIMRQVQVVAGTLVALGVALGAFVHPWFLAIAGFVGCGLMFAGLSGWCGMAKMLAVMPWNRPARTGGA